MNTESSPSNKNDFKRAPFPNDLQAIRSFLPELLPILEIQKDWYASIYLERKNSKIFAADLKKTNVAESLSAGIVLRIYDGYTLYEKATDNWDPSALKKAAQELVEHVKSQQSLKKDLPLRTYQAPTWADRLNAPLEKELTSQIPSGVNAHTPVHFGIRFQKDPTRESIEGFLTLLKGIVQKSKTLAPEAGLKAEELSYIASQVRYGIEDSVFVDRETNLSQSLYRMALTLTLMSGSDKTSTRVGGLGGIEALDIPEEELRELLGDLAAMKKAERLIPGQYRVLFGPSLSGVLAHEAFGHSQEGDTCARGRSKAWDFFKSGALAGNKNSTILNNPAIFENGTTPLAAWGSYFFDEEGWLAQEQVILDEGKLTSPMTNLTSAIRLGVARTANGKRESWAHGVYTRQTNTYFSAGKSTYQELLAQIQDGYLATHTAGGMEDPKGMGIQVGVAYLKEVKYGKITGRLFKGPAGGDIQMTGYTPDVLNSIIGKSKIDAMKSGPDTAKHPMNDVGGCGKYHKEFVYAGCGGPYLLMDGITLG